MNINSCPYLRFEFRARACITRLKYRYVGTENNNRHYSTITRANHSITLKSIARHFSIRQLSSISTKKSKIQVQPIIESPTPLTNQSSSSQLILTAAVATAIFVVTLLLIQSRTSKSTNNFSQDYLFQTNSQSPINNSYDETVTSPSAFSNISKATDVDNIYTSLSSTTTSSFLSSFPQLLSTILTLFNDDYLLLSCLLYVRTRELLEHHLQLYTTTAVEAESLQNYYNELKLSQYQKIASIECELLPIMQSLKSQLPLSTRIQSNLNNNIDINHNTGDKGSWTLISKDSNIATYYKSTPTDDTFSFRVTGVVDAPIFNIFVILNEVNLYSHFLPILTYSHRELISKSRIRMISQLIGWLPAPFSSREALMYVYGDVWDGQIGIYLKSIQNENNDNDNNITSSTVHSLPLPSPTSNVRVTVLDSSFLLSPVTDGTYVSATFNINPHIYFLPHWLLKLTCSRFSSLILDLLQKQSIRIWGTDNHLTNDNEWKMAIRNNERIYGEVKRRLEE